MSMFGPSRRDLIRAFERERHAWTIERGNLLDRIMVLAGTPWTPPPVQTTGYDLDEGPGEPMVYDPDQLDYTIEAG